VPQKTPDYRIGQSMAALEWLEEAHPDARPLLPPAPDLVGRATVRSLANIIACDTQPVTNMRILKRIRVLGGDANQWARELMADGLAAYEAALAGVAGKYSYGDNVTIADVCLVPAVWGALRFEVDISAYPTIKRIFEAISEDPAVAKAHWKNQEDTPLDLR